MSKRRINLLAWVGIPNTWHLRRTSTTRSWSWLAVCDHAYAEENATCWWSESVHELPWPSVINRNILAQEQALSGCHPQLEVLIVLLADEESRWAESIVLWKMPFCPSLLGGSACQIIWSEITYRQQLQLSFRLLGRSHLGDLGLSSELHVSLEVHSIYEINLIQHGRS